MFLYVKMHDEVIRSAPGGGGEVAGGGGGRWRVLPCMGHVGTCGPKCYGFSAVLVVNRISILADFGHSRVCSLYSSLDLGIVYRPNWTPLSPITIINQNYNKILERDWLSAA